MAKSNNQYKEPQAEENAERFQSDAERLANKHLADPNHVITDEELASIRIGMTPPPDVPTRQAVDEAGDRVSDRKLDKEDDTLPGAQKITPWDVVE